MIITETIPTQRAFILEVSEQELHMLTDLVGLTKSDDVRKKYHIDAVKIYNQLRDVLWSNISR